MGDIEPYAEPDPVRLSDAEREDTIRRLTEAASEGRITMAELEIRSAAVHQARFTREIEPVVADLPTTARPAQRKLGWLISMLGGREWTGRWRPSLNNVALTFMGAQVIDLSEVEVDSVTIYSLTFMGGTEIVVPADAELDDSGFVLLGAISRTAESSPSGRKPPMRIPPMRVKVRAWGLMGGCDIRNPEGEKK